MNKEPIVPQSEEFKKKGFAIAWALMLQYLRSTLDLPPEGALCVWKSYLDKWQEEDPDSRTVLVEMNEFQEERAYFVGVKDAKADPRTLGWLADELGGVENVKDKDTDGVAVMFVSQNEMVPFMLAFIVASTLSGAMYSKEEVEDIMRVAEEAHARYW